MIKQGILFLFLCCTTAYGWHYEVGADALYWKPCNEPFHYAEYFLPDGEDDQRTLEPDYEWGFRLFGVLSDDTCVNFLELEWDHVIGSTRKTDTNDRPPAVLNPFQYSQQVVLRPAEAITGFQHTHYNRVSLKLAHHYFTCGCGAFYGYLGGRWFDISVDDGFMATTTETDTIVSFSSRTDVCGGGLEVGVGGQIDLFCHLGLAFRFGGLAAVADRSHTALSRFEGGNREKNTYSQTRCIPGFDVRGALQYTYGSTCWWARLELGYELTHYFEALLREQPTIATVNVLSLDFGMSGPFFGLILGF